MQDSQRKLMAVAVLGGIVAAALSACSDLGRMAQPQTPYDLPSAGAVSAVYSASSSSRGDASASASAEMERRAAGKRR
jgi:hypothetical protein